uniref:C-type lectin domain-containing protein n=1 Tax=Timema shepardi TaxID=629360 RepID=A0A7R9AMX0_TIMSH|nr:unnamed protein product [Timema shepardi]
MEGDVHLRAVVGSYKSLSRPWGDLISSVSWGLLVAEESLESRGGVNLQEEGPLTTEVQRFAFGPTTSSRTSVELNTTSALANYATEAGVTLDIYSFSPRVSSIECSVGLSQLCKKSLPPTMRSTLAFQTTLWLILVAAHLASCESSSQQCPASRPYALSFSVVSRRNLTGHWKSELKMQNNGGSDVSGNKEDGPWEVDLVQTSEMTKSGEIFTVTAILEGMEQQKLHLTSSEGLTLLCESPALTEGAKLAKVEGCPSCQAMTGLTAGTGKSVPKSLAAHLNATASEATSWLESQSSCMRCLNLVCDMRRWRHVSQYWCSEQCLRPKPQPSLLLSISKSTRDCGWSRELENTPCDCRIRLVSSRSVAAAVAGPPAKPGPGYELVPDLGYYKLHTSLVTWEEGRNTCSQEGAHLAIPRSQKEVNVLLGILSRHPKIQDGELNKYAFTGIHDQYSEGHFMDIFGNPADMTVLKWFPGQPNDGGKALQNCIGLMREGKINDIYCHNKLPFLCEQKIQVY